MPILLRCPGCRAQLSAPRSFVGRRGRCPKCKALLSVEAARPRHDAGGLPATEIHVPLPRELGFGPQYRGDDDTRSDDGSVPTSMDIPPPDGPALRPDPEK